MSFCRPKFTNAGRDLQLRSIGGTEIQFTRMKVGDGEITSSMDYQTFTDLISPKVNLVLTGLAIEDGYARIKGYFSNAGSTGAFNYRELGLFAKDPDDPTKEILYCYANYGDDYEYIAEPSEEIIERSITIVAIVDDAENVTAVLDSSAIYATTDDITDYITIHNNDPYAHPGREGIKNIFGVFYVDPSTAEESSARTGSQEHPFKYLQEAIDEGSYTKYSNVTIRFQGNTKHVKWNSTDPDAVTIYGYNSISLQAQGGYIFDFRVYFQSCKNIAMNGVKTSPESSANFTAKADTPYSVKLTDCTRAFFIDVSDNASSYAPTNWIHLERCGMAKVHSCTLSTKATNAIRADNCDLVALTAYTTIGSGVHTALYLDDSAAYVLCANSAVTPATIANHALYFDRDTVDKISDGTWKNHIGTTTNPHNVSLTQAQAKGGTVNVAHGGTGKTTLENGGLLKGNGASAVGYVLGTGALYASTSGNPQFGTLPVALGGTGRTDTGVWFNVDADDTSKSLGSLMLPGNLLVEWGHCRTTDNLFTSTFHREFADNKYTLTFTVEGFTVDERSDITKATTNFSIKVIRTGVNARHTDWIAIGKAKS